MISIEQTKTVRLTGTVIARAGRVHTVAIDGAETVCVDSQMVYPPQARVTVVAGMIVGRAGAAPTLINYQQ